MVQILPDHVVHDLHQAFIYECRQALADIAAARPHRDAALLETAVHRVRGSAAVMSEHELALRLKTVELGLRQDRTWPEGGTAGIVASLEDAIWRQTCLLNAKSL